MSPLAHDSREPTAADARAWARAAQARGEPVCLVTVARGRGSLPRPAGTRMLVAARQVLGTIGGGHLELQALQRARDWLAAGGGPAQDWSLSLGPSLGQCCGGALTLRFQPLDACALTAWTDAPPRFRLHLFGAGHVGRALVTVLAALPGQVRWIDEREDEFPKGTPWPATVEVVVADPAEAEVAAGQPGDAWLVLTHSHALDLRLVEAILRRGDAGWLGLIGSATKRARFLNRLDERGLGDAARRQLRCPVGLPGLAGKEPGVIAVAVAAELLLQHPPSSTLNA